MKRFNTDRIRQRMREHNERFPHAKGKLLSSPPVRISIPPQTDKENFVPGPNDTKSMNKPNQTSTEGMTKDRFPQISRSVTVSEGDDGEGSFSGETVRSEPSRDSDDEDDSTVPSVWAMMENYHGYLKDGPTPSNSPVRIEENDSDESSNYHSTEESLGSNATSTDADNQIFDDAIQNESTKITSEIQWSESEDVELMQSSQYAKEVSVSGNDAELDTSGNYSIDSSTIDVTRKAAIFRQDTHSHVGAHALASESALWSNGRQGQPTPVRVREEWVDSGDNEEFSMNQNSLMQESVAQSIQTASSRGSRQNILGSDSDSQLSLSILPEVCNMTGFESNVSPTATDFPQKDARKPKLQVQTQELDSIYSDRLGELESNLKLQQNNTDEVQNRLKRRVMELEQALKVTVATPKGTVVDENPLKILLNRNQTLVKEVRFADQTCVELSSKISELEKRNETLQKQVLILERENDSLRSDNVGEECVQPKSNAENDSTSIQDLKNELSVAKESLHAKIIDEENLQRILHQALGDLNANNDTPGLSSFMSERNIVCQHQSILQQIGALVEKARSSLQVDKLKQEMHDLRSENIALKSDLLLDQLQVNPEAVPIAIPTEDPKEILQLQKENEFLGRQLGLVQEKLDESQNRISDERHKSDSLKLQLRRSVETCERLIEPLEKRLLEVTNSNPKLQEVADVDKRLLSLEKEFVHVKASIASLKSESERFLTASVFDSDKFSSVDQQQNIVSMVRSTISRMGKNYEQLELEVEKLTEGFSARLDCLTLTISHLRSSLLFEKESVSSDGSNGHEEAKKEQGDHYCGSSINFIDATIPVEQFNVEGNCVDGIVDLSKAPRKHDISVTSELDDISRLLNDDLTLESIVKSVSVLTPMSNMDAFKESLETAVNECKRVKERSIQLKEKIESHKLTIQQLEQDKEKLSIDASRRNEEFCLVEKALKDAKEEIGLLRSTISASHLENESLYEQLKVRERERNDTKEANVRLMKSIAEIEKEKEAFEIQVKQCEVTLMETKKKLKSVTISRDEYEERFHESQSNVSKKVAMVIEQKELESAETRRALQLARREKSELKRLHEDGMKRLSQETEAKLKLESQVNELQHSNLQAQSDLEDKDLESKFACEDMRKERAELKYQLSQSEKEVLSLKESYSSLKAKVEEKRQKIEDTEFERSDLQSNINQMTEKRISFVNLLENLGCCEDLIRVLSSKDYHSDRSNPLDKAMKEIDCWKCVIPLIGDKIKSLHHSVATIPKMELEIEKLTEDLSNYEKREEKQFTSQNERLLDLLRQAEEEMERSTVQIKEMSQAMALMQQREKEANINVELMGSELAKLKNQSEASGFENKEDLTNMKNLLIDASAELEKRESQIVNLKSEMNIMALEIEKVTSLLRSKESEEHSLKANIESCEKKNSRLREYIRKLTTKCEEWEVSYDRQSRAIDRLQEKKSRMKEKAADIASRYRALVGDINRRKKMHQHDREKWNHERSNLNSVHAALERELEQIAKELA